MTALPRALAVLFVFVLALSVAVTARALDDAKPSPTCGPSKTESAPDSEEPNTGVHSDALEITGAFLKHEPDKGAEATTANFVLKDLTLTPPSGSTSMMWTMKFASDQELFVRAIVDFSGTVVYEHGVLVTNAAGVFPRYEYRGDIAGKMWEGKDGVIQLVIPPEIGGKSGTALKTFTAEAATGKTVVPTSAPPTPTRGVSYVNDDLALGSWTVTACTAGGPTGPTGPAGPGGTPTGPGTTTGAPALPVKLVTKSAKAKKAKKGRTLKLRVRASETITNLAIQLRNARKTFGTARLASVDGGGTLKLKLKKTLKKGRYVIDMVGDDAQGRHRATAAKFRVK